MVPFEFGEHLSHTPTKPIELIGIEVAVPRHADDQRHGTALASAALRRSRSERRYVHDRTGHRFTAFHRDFL